MALRDDIKSIDQLNQLAVRTDRVPGVNRVGLLYNEMTFIPYLNEHIANRFPGAGPTVDQHFDKLKKISTFIKNTDLNTLTNVALVDQFAFAFSPYQIANDDIKHRTGLQAEINEAWFDFYTYKLPKHDKKTPSVISDLENQIDDINDIADKLKAQQTTLIKFFLVHHAFTEQLNTSMFHPDDKAYVISRLNAHTEEMPDVERSLSLLKTYHELNEKFLKNIKKHITDIAPNTFITQADAFIAKEKEHQQDSSVENFLATKLLSEDVKVNVEFTAGQKIEKVHLFSDNSLAYKTNNEYHTIKQNHELKEFTKDLFKSGVSFILRKKPTLVPFFVNKLNEDHSPNNAIKAATSLIDNFQVLKQYNFDLSSMSKKSFEAIDDAIHDIVYKNKIKQFAFSILSAKYKHHFNEETEPYFKALFDNDVTTSQLQTFVGKKVAALKDNADVIKMINGMLDHFNGFTPNALSERLADFGITPLYDKNNVVVFEVDSYDKCKKLGSTSWCIVRDEEYFDQYVTHEYNNQYILYDFNKLSTDIQSMVGFTVSASGFIYAEHWKNDDSISSYGKDEGLLHIQRSTIYQNRNKHSISDDDIKHLEECLNIKEQNNTKPLKMRVA